MIKFELTRYPERRLEHALNDALNLLRDDYGTEYELLNAACRRLELTGAELLALYAGGFLALAVDN